MILNKRTLIIRIYKYMYLSLIHTCGYPIMKGDENLWHNIPKIWAHECTDVFSFPMWMKNIIWMVNRGLELTLSIHLIHRMLNLWPSVWVSDLFMIIFCLTETFQTKQDLRFMLYKILQHFFKKNKTQTGWTSAEIANF